MKSIKIVISAFLEAGEIIKKANLKKYYILPGIIGSLMFVFFIFFGIKVSNYLWELIIKLFKIDEFYYWISWIIKLFLTMGLFFLYFLIYKTLLLVVLSPILSYASERVDSYLTNKKFDISLKDSMSFLARGANIGMICFIKQILVMIVLFFLEILIPPVVIISPIIVFLMQGYFTGFAFMDYTLERYKFTTKESMKFLSKKRTYSILCGTIFNILMFIPIIGIFIAPIMTCVAVTKLTLDLINNDEEYEKYTIIG